MPNEKLPTDQHAQAHPHSPLLPVCRHHIIRRETSSKRTKKSPFVIISEDDSLLKDKDWVVSTTVRTATVGQIFIIEDPELDVTFTKKITKALKEVEYEDPTCDWISAFKKFREANGDYYDFLAMVPDIHLDELFEVLPTGMPPLQSHHLYVFNDVTGINLPQYHRRGLFNSGRLQGIAALEPRAASLRIIRLHEIAHRWGAYVHFKKRQSDRSTFADLLDRQESHWAWEFNKDESSLGGDQHPNEDWVENSDGSFTRYWPSNPDHYAYCPLDLYLMGMLTPSEVPPFWYIQNLQAAPTAENPNRFSGRRVNLSVDNIIWANGPRLPHAADSQRSFRLGCVVLTKDLDQGKKLAAVLEEYRIAVTKEFREATQSRGMLDTYLYDSSYDGIYIKHHPDDTGIEPSQGVFWNSPDIWVRNEEDGHEHTTHQDIRPNEDNWIYLRVRNNGWRQPSGEITVNIFQTGPGTEFLYPQDWKWDDDHRIGSQQIEPVPPGGERVVQFKWEWEKITRLSGGAIGYPSLLVEILPTHPTQTKLRYVWEDRRIAQKNVTILRAKSGSRGLTFPFLIGAHSQPNRSVRIRIRQKRGRYLHKVTLDLGKKEKWQGRLKKRGSLEATGGVVMEQRGGAVFEITKAYESARITLPLLESRRERLTLGLNWGRAPLVSDTAFEITQLNEQNEVVGGLDLIVRNERSDDL